MRSVNQKIFLINIIVILAALVVWRTTSSIDTLPSVVTNGNEVKSGLFIGFSLLLTLVILVQIYLHRTITRPLRRLAKDIKIRTYSGKLDPVAINGHDEIAQLADLFNNLQKKLKNQVGDLKYFAEEVCHEIRTPLASIVSSIEFMHKKKTYSEELALVIRNEALRLDSIASALLETTFDIEQLNRTEINCESLFLKAVEANGLSDRTKLSSTGINKTMLADEVLMRQVFENLLSNAQKFSPPTSTLNAHFTYFEPTVGRRNGSMMFTLANEGICLSEEQLTRVFDRFVSIKNQQSGEGYGIGLSLCKDIIEAHGGDIRMENLASNGVIVAFEIPN